MKKLKCLTYLQTFRGGLYCILFLKYLEKDIYRCDYECMNPEISSIQSRNFTRGQISEMIRLNKIKPADDATVAAILLSRGVKSED